MKTNTKFKGKIIYNPSGKAEEYSYWAANFYNGCSGNCDYCYMKDPPLSTYFSNKPTIKKKLYNEIIAIGFFKKEIKQNIDSLRKHGLFFNFNSDPFLKSSYQLNYDCINICILYDIPVKILTKQTWWIDNFKYSNPLVNIGFTLTGHDELEPGCATNEERIKAMKTLKERGYKTWASIEPIIDFKASSKMIIKTWDYCDHYKIGLKSKTKYEQSDISFFVKNANKHLKNKNTKIYWKKELLKQAGINRQDLPINCVDRDYF